MVAAKWFAAKFLKREFRRALPLVAALWLLAAGTARAQSWTWTTEDVDKKSADATAIAVDADGNVHLSYGSEGTEWKYAFRPAGTTRWDKTTLAPGAVNYVSLVLDSAGNPYVTPAHLLLALLNQPEGIARPLLIAASLLTAQDFSEIVQALERFCFRYSVIVQAPPLEAIAIYNHHAVDIRRAPENYRPRALIRDLSELVGQRAPDEVFRPRLEALHYPRSESRKPLKYFLITLEHFVRWFDEGAQGCAKCRDSTRVLDFENSTIEHIYAENAAQPDAQLQPYLDTLGNLTILGPEDNDAAGAKSFADKKRYFA